MRDMLKIKGSKYNRAINYEKTINSEALIELEKRRVELEKFKLDHKEKFFGVKKNRKNMKKKEEMEQYIRDLEDELE